MFQPVVLHQSQKYTDEGQYMSKHYPFIDPLTKTTCKNTPGKTMVGTAQLKRNKRQVEHFDVMMKGLHYKILSDKPLK